MRPEVRTIRAFNLSLCTYLPMPSSLGMVSTASTAGVGLDDHV